MPAVVATTIMSFCGVLIETSMNVTFPTLMKQFGIDAGLIQWVTTANLLTVAISIPLSAYLIRNVSEKNLFVSSNLFFLLGVILDSIAGNFELLLAGRILQGIGTGLALPLAMHIILEHVPLEKRGFMVGVATMTTCFAPAIGPTYGGIILHHFDWNKIFLFLVPILAISFVVGIMSIPQRKIETRTGFNFWRILLFGIGPGAVADRNRAFFALAAFAQHHGTVDVLFFQQKEASHQSERLFQSAFRLVHVWCFGHAGHRAWHLIHFPELSSDRVASKYRHGRVVHASGRNVRVPARTGFRSIDG